MKHMKKSMFITTLAMVVVLVVALSTATFAWYTANTQVGVTKTALTSATSSTASLVIDNQAVTNVDETNSSVSLTLSGTYVPMVYTSDSVAAVDTTTYASFIAAFKTFTRDSNSNFASTPTGTSPATISAVSGSAAESSNIVLTNVGGQAMSSVTTKIVIEPFYEEMTNVEIGTTSVYNKYTRTGSAPYVYTKITDENAKAAAETTYYEAGHDYLRVAVFAGSSANNLVLKGIYGTGTAQRANATNLGKTDSEQEGHMAAIGDPIATAVGNATLNSDLSTAFKASDTDLQIYGTVASMGNVFVKVVAWFEGGSMNNIDAGKVAAFSMTFGGTTAVANP